MNFHCARLLFCLLTAALFVLRPAFGFAQTVQTPANTNATPQTRALLAWLAAQQGKHILSGQAEPAPGGNILATSPELEFERIKTLSGQTPAIRAFDLFQVTPMRPAARTNAPTATTELLPATQRAIAWWRGNGIVAVQWHWMAPTRSGGYGYATQNDTGNTNDSFNLTRAIISGTPERDELLSGIDAAAVQLAALQEAGAPVLWRPLPECSGPWRWWGAQGPEPLKKLWKLMFERLTFKHKLNNLIWVFNPAEPADIATWYPGDDFVDAISLDRYAPDGEFPSFATDYQALQKTFGARKLLALSELGALPSPALLQKDNAFWAWFCVWSGPYILDGKINPTNHIADVFRDPFVLNQNALPRLKELPVLNP
jgi:mannan endo-1,4-beta-mannosidase